MTSVALLRGINVSGHKIVKMTNLVKLFESLGLENARTYVQSGNVVFDHDPDATPGIVRRIETKIHRAYGFPVHVILRTSDELQRIISRNPFAKQPNIEIDRLHVTFLSGLPEKRFASELDLPIERNEKFKVIGKEVYLYCPNGYGRSTLNNAAFERKLNVVATTRNWRTTNKLLEMARGGKP